MFYRKRLHSLLKDVVLFFTNIVFFSKKQPDVFIVIKKHPFRLSEADVFYYGFFLKELFFVAPVHCSHAFI